MSCGQHKTTLVGSRKPLFQQQFVASEEIETHGIQQYLKGEKWQDVMFVVQPLFSWDHFSVTELAFRRLLASLQTFTPFLRVVHAFGKKTNDKQRARDSAYYRIQPSSNPSWSYEFCYNIRYFELNGRGRGNPWSLRQTGIYQRCLPNRQSTWLMLSYSSYMFDRISAAFEEKSNLIYEACEASSLLPHLFILFAATRNWVQYIEDLRRRVMVFEEKAYSSRIDGVHLDDYKLLFADVQAIMSLGDTITTTRAVITGQRDIISKCSDIQVELHKRGPRRCDCDMANTLRTLKADLKHHNEAMVTLARITSKITPLLSAILATRANDDLRTITTTIQTGISTLQLQSGQTGLNMAGLLHITTQGQKDAMTIKILAQIATLFLPASLIASLFSSPVFSNSSSNLSYVDLYLAITLPVLLITLLTIFFLDKGLPRGAWLRRLF